jgi:DNA (cytosine-5)-methyltransferase 1
MTSANHDHIPLDAQGLRRSAKLPSMRGEFIKLPPKLATSAHLEQWQERLRDPHAIVVLDLFCGAGGMSLGFETAGCFPAVGVDQNSWAVMSHSYNFLSKGMVQDICAIPDPRAFIEELGIQRPIDIIIGGPPCQGFALIGRGKLKSLGPEKEAYYRNVLNNLYREFIRFVTELQPLAFVMENVPALATYENGILLERIIQAFPDYTVDKRILDAEYSGVPQSRRRLFIQGSRIGNICWPDVAEALHQPVTVAQAIDDLPERAPGMLSDEALPYHLESARTRYQRLMREQMPDDQVHVVWDHITRQLREDDQAIFAMMPQGGKYRDLPDEWKRYQQDGKNFADKYWRLIANEPSWTITAHIAKDAYRYIHPTQNRTLSVREFARLQSFPDRFRFCGPRTERLRQIGNAVPPLLAQSIARSIVEQIHTYRSEHDKDESEQIAEVNAIG